MEKSKLSRAERRAAAAKKRNDIELSIARNFQTVYEESTESGASVPESVTAAIASTAQLINKLIKENPQSKALYLECLSSFTDRLRNGNES